MPTQTLSMNNELSKITSITPNRIFFGGSFNPPHLGHTQLPISIAQSLNIEQVIFVPASRSPFKAAHPAADHHRIAMLELALEEHTLGEIWQHELIRAHDHPNEPSYWADTWKAVQQQCASGTNMFLIGTDQARSMHRWKRYTEFWKDAIVMLRLETGSNTKTNFDSQCQELVDKLSELDVWSDDDLDHWRSRIIQAPTVDASSTQIREALANPQTRELQIKGLDPRVQEYILSHDLYR